MSAFRSVEPRDGNSNQRHNPMRIASSPAQQSAESVIITRSDSQRGRRPSVTTGGLAKTGSLIQKRARAPCSLDNAHLAAQHVNELRERLDPRPPEESTEPPRRCWPIGIVHSSS